MTRFPPSVGSFERATNDLGEFRLYGLPPGTYYLALSPSIPSNTRLTTDAEVRWAMQPPGSERQAAPPLGTGAGYARLDLRTAIVFLIGMCGLSGSGAAIWGLSSAARRMLTRSIRFGRSETWVGLFET